MPVLILLLVVSLGAVLATLTLAEWPGVLLIAGPSTAIAIILLQVVWIRRWAHACKAATKCVILDGSNVMHWKGGKPAIATVQEVTRYLSERGFTAGVVFDANAGYLISDRYLHDSGFGHLLELPEDRVMVVPKGTPADPIILAAARDHGAQVVTNDQFRDWAEDFPDVQNPEFVIRGGYRSGKLWLNLGPETT
jgi:Zc3h12a-like Ribonuclease NYN domain